MTQRQGGKGDYLSRITALIRGWKKKKARNKTQVKVIKAMRGSQNQNTTQRKTNCFYRDNGHINTGESKKRNHNPKKSVARMINMNKNIGKTKTLHQNYKLKT